MRCGCRWINDKNNAYCKLEEKGTTTIKTTTAKPYDFPTTASLFKENCKIN